MKKMIKRLLAPRYIQQVILLYSICIAQSRLAVCLLLFLVTPITYSQVATQFMGDSWSDFTGGAKAVCADSDVDNDNDGLIELCHLEDLDAIRYQLDGSGLV